MGMLLIFPFPSFHPLTMTMCAFLSTSFGWMGRRESSNSGRALNLVM